MDRRVPGELVSAPGEDVEEDLFSAWHLSLDSDGFSLSPPAATRYSRLPQPQGFDLGSWREEKSVLRNAAVLSRAGSRIAEVTSLWQHPFAAWMNCRQSKKRQTSCSRLCTKSK